MLFQSVRHTLNVVEVLVGQIRIAVLQKAIKEHEDITEAEDFAFADWQIGFGFSQGSGKRAYAPQYDDDEIGN